ncbi:phage/plasmid primase, P4 family [Microbacterium sp. Au-Mic1]|uniref:DNA primase family protein n=1 Tax=Microbacterium sp. Au-Mic1 TaxID=2906457 RepID=UPI001E3193B7|nr:DNA primase family protein [Microbacterium sp. Au-Mic1]MCE4024673.1 phage/plasmid primase, P4 family [Microbacterium sp. Au-Mic1]
MSAGTPAYRGDNYFDPKHGFMTLKLAKAVAHDLGVGPDGELWLYESGVWRPAPEELVRRIVSELGNRYRRSYVASVEDTVKSSGIPRIPAEPQGGVKWAPLINLKNGVYNWQTDYFQGHSPEHLSTLQLPITYRKGADCPNFLKWLDEVVPGDMHALVWEVIGYMLMIGNPLSTAILLLGPGGTGKSTFLRVLEEMLGRENIATESLKSLSENRFAAASLYGKTANILGDLDDSYLKDASLFKAITGGDTLTAERKYRDSFPFRPYAVPVFSANKVWRSSDDSDGYFRRWTVLPFTTKLDRSQRFDEGKLYAETPGIFNRAMDALRDLHERGEFDVRGTAREAREEFEQDSDPMRLWLAQDDLVDADRGNESLRTKRADLFARYKTWCQANDYKHSSNSGEFYKSLKGLGYNTDHKSNGNRYVVGIRVYIPGMAGVQ